VVASFDDARGYGEITADDGTAVFFHCTAIADGSRTIEIGRGVAFTLEPGHRGRWEAQAIRPA
jgi:cold shock CspA family protein